MTDIKRKALVVDDNSNNLMLEKDILEVAGFVVFEAETAAAGVAIARRELPDVIIMDLRLPDMRGSEAARILRTDVRTCHIPIVFVTASVLTDGKEEIKFIPNSGFIGKPINTRTFANEIIQYITRRKPTILLVDDQPQNIELLEARLMPEGYGILTAINAEEALARLAANPIDLILLDVMMPGMDGFELTRRIRQNSEFHALPIILVTALRETEDRVRGIEAGCDDFLSKPVDKHELLARVRSLLKVKAYNDLLTNYRKELESEVALRTVELRHALDGIKSASLETMYRLARAAEFKSKDIGLHIERVSRYAAAVARGLGMNETNVEAILYASSMHDVGKIGIPEYLLMKAGKLDLSERELVKQHTTIGASILSGSDARYIMMAEAIALSHHEKWDGSGYPAGLKGKAIPIVGRITAIADVFDALTSERSYKVAFSLEDSLSIIREGRGIHFDPEVVDAFLAVMPEILAIKRDCPDLAHVPQEAEHELRPALPYDFTG